MEVKDLGCMHDLWGLKSIELTTDRIAELWAAPTLS